MAKKSFKENNPVLQFMTSQQETQEEQTPPLRDRKSKEAKGKKGKKVKAAAEAKAEEVITEEVKTPEAKIKKVKVKKAKTKEAKTGQGKKEDKEKKLPRIDKILTEDNLRYLKDIAGMERVSIGVYINKLVNEDQVRQSAGNEQGKTNLGEETKE